MCVIIEKKAGVDFPADAIANAAERNSDGFGYMFYDEDSDRIRAMKSLKNDAKEIQHIFKNLKNKEVCFHYRYKTHGNITVDQSHPFRILNKEEHGMDMFFMHNGTISGVPADKTRSDTDMFCETVLRPLLKDNPLLIEDEAFQKLLGMSIGGSKLLFMYDKGKVVIINKDLGTMYHECWVSNKHSFDDVSYTYSGKRSSNYSSTWSKSDEASYRRSVVASRTTGDPRTAYKLGEDTIKVGDTVDVLSNVDYTFQAEGSIESITDKLVRVIFTNYEVQSITRSFHLDDGECLTSEDYYIEALEQKSSSVVTLNGKVDEDSIDDLTEDEEVAESQISDETGFFLDSEEIYTRHTLAELVSMPKEELIAFLAENKDDEAYVMVYDLLVNFMHESYLNAFNATR